MTRLTVRLISRRLRTGYKMARFDRYCQGLHVGPNCPSDMSARQCEQPMSRKNNNTARKATEHIRNVARLHIAFLILFGKVIVRGTTLHPSS